MLERWIKRFLQLVLKPNVSAHAVAMGTAIGVCIAFTPTIGLQMIIAAVLATALRVSRAAAVIPVWITNPVTIVPIYSFTYWLGWQVTGGPTPREFLSRFNSVLVQLENHSAWEFFDRFTRLLTLGVETLVPLTVGGLIVGIIGGAISYGLVRLLIRWYPRPHGAPDTKVSADDGKDDVRRAA